MGFGLFFSPAPFVKKEAPGAWKALPCAAHLWSRGWIYMIHIVVQCCAHRYTMHINMCTVITLYMK